MGKWNFDFLFSGKLLDNMERQIAFGDGLKALRQERQQVFAESVLRGDPAQESDYAKVREANEALGAFQNDPRIQEMKKQGIGMLIRKAADEAFGPEKKEG